MNNFELITDAQLCTNYITKMQTAHSLAELKEAHRQAQQKLKEVFNDKKELLKKGE